MAQVEQKAPKAATAWAPADRAYAWTPARSVPAGSAAADERSARTTLRAQVARLERELSAVVASAFPYVRPGEPYRSAPHGAPRLLSLGELELQRDELAGALARAQAQARERTALAERSRALLEEMRRAPERHKFVRLKVSDLGDGHCGYWEVRPRLGLVGMLAGWWEVKLSSGCP